jgi:hypothetical protein
MKRGGEDEIYEKLWRGTEESSLQQDFPKEYEAPSPNQEDDDLHVEALFPLQLFSNSAAR